MPFFPTNIENKSILPFEDENESSYKLPLDLNRLLVSNPPSTFYARMAGAEKDLLIIDRSIEPINGNLVVVYQESEFKLRRLHINEQGIYKLSNETSAPTVMSENSTLWGRVVYYIKSV